MLLTLSEMNYCRCEPYSIIIRYCTRISILKPTRWDGTFTSQLYLLQTMMAYYNSITVPPRMSAEKCVVYRIPLKNGRYGESETSCAQYRSSRKSYPHFSYNRHCEKVFWLAPALNYSEARFSSAKTKRTSTKWWALASLCLWQNICINEMHCRSVTNGTYGDMLIGNAR